MKSALGWPQITAFGISIAIFVTAILLLFGGPYRVGVAILAIVMSAFLWLLASIVGETGWGQRSAPNLLNALAASLAALAGVLTTTDGWDAILDLLP